MKDEARIVIRSTLKAPTLRAADDGTPGRFLEGYAAKFGIESSVLFDDYVTDEDGDAIPFIEVIDPHTFDRTLRENPDILALYNHDRSSVLGRTTSGTLKLWVDQVGLAFRVEIPDTTAGRDIRASVARGDIRGCSFAGNIPEGGSRIETRSGGPAMHTLSDVDLHEITAGTAFPAYPSTEVALRARTDRRHMATTREVAAWLRRERERLRLDES